MITLRKYQLELIDKTYKSLREGNKRIIVQSPAGSGKTVTMSEIAKRSTDKGNRVLFVVHRREIVDQVKQTFIRNNVDMNLCDVGMIQTVTNKVKKNKVQTPSLILIDEAHHALSKTYVRIVEHFNNAIVLGFTATPWRMSKKGFTDVFDDLILGKTVEWLINNNNLAPYKYYSVSMIDDNKLKRTSTGDYSKSSIDEAIGKTIYGDVIENYEKYAPNMKTIIYAHSVEASKRVANEFYEHGYAAMQVDGTTKKDVREYAMTEFKKGNIRILVNADLYGEGVDVPDCQCVILLRPTESLTLFIQQTMRSMRYQKNKIAIIIDHVGNYSRHGLPDTEHDWEKHFKGGGQSKENTISVKTCDECLFTWEPSEHNDISKRKCPNCGHVEEIKVVESELEVDEKAELEEIKDTSVTLDFREPKDCKNMKELYELARNRGYKKGWAYHQGKLRGFIK